MSQPSAADGAGGVPIVVESGTRFEGLVAFRGVVRVEGQVVGQVVADGTLILGPKGELRGRIEADRVTVEGACDGEIEARERIELRPSARVQGRIVAPCIVIADGSLFDGHCEAGPAVPSPRPSAALPRVESATRPATETAAIPA